MGIVSGVVLIILGALALPGLVAKKSPQAKEMLDKLEPYKGWIGLIVFVWGVWGIMSAIVSLGWLVTWPLWWVTRLVGNVLNAGVGFLLGFSMIQKYALAKANDEAKEKAEQLREKLIGIQVPMGFACVIVGIWVILYELVLYRLLGI